MTSPRCSEVLPPGFQCTREPHDDDVHRFDSELPPIVNQLVAQAVDDLDRQQSLYLTWTRRAQLAWRWALLATACNLGAAVFALGNYWGWW